MFQVMVVKPTVDFAEQLGGGAQVDLSRTDIDVPHIGSQRRETGIDIGSVPIPGQQAVNGKGVSHVVDAGAVALVVNDAASLQQALKGVVNRGVA